MAVAETVSFGFVFVITILFSMLAIGKGIDNGKRLTLDWILPILDGVSFICWLILVPLHIAFVGTSSAFLDAPAILYFAFAIIFLLLTIKAVLDNLAVSTVVRNSVDTVD